MKRGGEKKEENEGRRETHGCPVAKNATKNGPSLREEIEKTFQIV